jgi:hypothetical protein
MNKQYKQTISMSDLNAVEGAIAEREQHGHAEETLFGFAATVTNAAPPVDEAFRRTLRDRIMAEAVAQVKEEETHASWKNVMLSVVEGLGRIMPFKHWPLSLRGGLAVVLILILASVVALYIVPGRFGNVDAPGVGEQVSSVPPLPQEDVDALVGRLNEASAPRTVAVFPPDYAPSLAERIQHNVVPLVFDGASALGSVLPAGGLVDVILVHQDNRDLSRRVWATLERQLYRLYRPEAGPETFGPLQRTLYVAGPEDVTLESVDARFENGIELVNAGVLDDLQPDAPLRITLEWRTEHPVADPVKVFTHLFCDGRLIAQRDAVPGNGAFPVPNWQPGEVVRDQFALQLPAALPAGVCQVQVGIYTPPSGMRYRVAEAGTDITEGNTAVIIQQLTVKD